MPRKPYKLFLGSAALVVAMLLAALAIVRSPVSSRPPLPNPNGYDDFIKASEGLPGSVGDFPTLDRDSLNALVSTNTDALRLVRLGVTRQCVVPMDTALTNISVMLNQLACMKRLALLLAAVGRSHEMEDRPGDAARDYTDAIRFGNEISRGGLVITRLVGIACEAIGGHALAKVVPKLSCEQARMVLTQLRKVDAGRVTWAEVLQNERYYTHHRSGARFNPIRQAIGWWQSRQPMQRAETKHRIIIAHERLLAAELALLCYQSEQGRGPTSLNGLVPNYLSNVPLDPFTGQQLIYRPQGTNWLLYSVGPDGVDDGGKPVGKGWPVKGDLLFDSVW